MLNKIKNAINKKCKNLNKLLIMNLTKTKFQYRWLDVSISLLSINFVSSNSFQAINRQPHLQYTLIQYMHETVHLLVPTLWLDSSLFCEGSETVQAFIGTDRSGLIVRVHLILKPLTFIDILQTGWIYVPECWGWSRSWIYICTWELRMV